MTHEEFVEYATTLKEIRDRLQKTELLKCIDCYNKRIIECIVSMPYERDCVEQIESVRKSIVNYYLERKSDADEIVNQLSKLIDILEEKIKSEIIRQINQLARLIDVLEEKAKSDANEIINQLSKILEGGK